MEEDLLIIKYDTNDGSILGYAILGGSIPNEIPGGEAYIEWYGVEPQPRYNYVVVNNQVVEKSEVDKQVYKDNIMAIAVRGDRTEKLTESDWRDLPSYPGTDQEAWRTYRQELRDISLQPGFPNNITWPVRP